MLGKKTMMVLFGIAGLLFFVAVPRVWPLLEMDFFPDRKQLNFLGRQFLQGKGWEVPGEALYSLHWERDENAQNFVVRQFGRDSLVSWMQRGVPFAFHRMVWKTQGEPAWQRVQFLPGNRFGFAVRLEEDARLDSISITKADSLIQNFLEQLDGEDSWQLVSVQRVRLEGRMENQQVWERNLGGVGGLRQRWNFALAGDRILRAETHLLLPAAALRAERKREAGVQGLLFLGIVIAAIWGIMGFSGMLKALRAGFSAGLPARLVGLVALGFTITYVLDSDRWFQLWDPLWPAPLAAVRSVLYRLAWDLPLLAAVFVLALAGIREDSLLGGRRSRTLRLALQCRLHPRRALGESLWAYGVAMVCGAVLVAGAALLVNLFDGNVQMQPQGFFAFTLNARFPGVSTVFFFLAIALAEESGYRLYAGSWFLRRGLHPVLAVIIPGVVYGLIHTPLNFLPPLDPWWGRALLLSAVGCVWGWAYLHKGALVVILSHWAANLFLFSWPVWVSGPKQALGAFITLMAPVFVLVLTSLWGKHIKYQNAPQYCRNPRN